MRNTVDLVESEGPTQSDACTGLHRVLHVLEHNASVRVSLYHAVLKSENALMIFR